MAWFHEYNAPFRAASGDCRGEREEHTAESE